MYIVSQTNLYVALTFLFHGSRDGFGKNPLEPGPDTGMVTPWRAPEYFFYSIIFNENFYEKIAREL